MAHVLLFPGPGQGHINPMLQFAKRLITKGIKATLVTTVYNSKSMQAEVDSIKIEAISDGYDEGGVRVSGVTAKEYIERFMDIGSRNLADLIQKYDNSGNPFTCIVYDSFFPWILDVGKRFGLFGAAFFTQSCAIFAIYDYVRRGWLRIPFVKQDDLLLFPGLPSLRKSDFPSYIADQGPYPDYLKIHLDQFSNLDKADWILINSFHELEAEVLTSLMDHWRVKPIGPTVPSMFLEKQIEKDNVYSLKLSNPNVKACMEWLDARETTSVIYVSFGSIAVLEAKQMEELAWALKKSNKHFLWAVRESEKIKLPLNFINEEAYEKGLVLTWCPQLEVLAHKAVGCFVTHCGWNSTLEALSLGVPLVGVPQWADQPTNAKYVEEVWEVGVRVKMDKNGIVKREEIELCIREAMEGLRGEVIKENATRWRELAKEAIYAGGSSNKNIEEFVEDLVRFKRQC